MSTFRTSRALARLLFAVSLGVSQQAQAHGPRHASAEIEAVPKSTAQCRKTEAGIAYMPGPRSTVVPRVVCRDPAETAVRSPAAQGLMTYGPRNTLFRK